MFNPKPYHTINREERHFGSLFTSALIYDEDFRRAVFFRLGKATHADLDPQDFEVFTEVAALRDYWFDLGDAKIYSKETHANRRTVLDMILKKCDYSPDLIDKEPVFWTLGKIGTGKLWCPSEWQIRDLTPIEKEKNDLVKIRWCFNAKPDLLIVSGKSCVFLELKVESGAGSNEHGYDQIEIQKLIGHYMKLLIPAYNDCSFHNSSLTLNNELSVDGITWREVITTLEKTAETNKGSKYVVDCLSQLNRYKVL